MNSNINFFDIKEIEFDEKKTDGKNEIKNVIKKNSIGDLTISDIQLGRISEKNTKYDKNNNFNQHIHVCNHVKYSNYANHLGNHHQAKYTLSKKRLRIPTHRLFDHKFHHKNHKVVKIQEPTNFSKIGLSKSKKEIEDESFFNYNDISQSNFMKNLQNLKDEKCCILV